MNLLLLDADVIINLHELELWPQIITKHQIFVSSIILHREAYKYKDSLGVERFIDLNAQIGKSIQKISATSEEINALKKNLDYADKQHFDDGEAEALTILRKEKDMAFCTADQLAMEISALLNLDDRVISMQQLLQEAGCVRVNIGYSLSDLCLKRQIDKGKLKRILNTKLI